MKSKQQELRHLEIPKQERRKTTTIMQNRDNNPLAVQSTSHGRNARKQSLY